MEPELYPDTNYTKTQRIALQQCVIRNDFLSLKILKEGFDHDTIRVILAGDLPDYAKPLLKRYAKIVHHNSTLPDLIGMDIHTGRRCNSFGLPSLFDMDIPVKPCLSPDAPVENVPQGTDVPVEVYDKDQVAHFDAWMGFDDLEDLP